MKRRERGRDRGGGRKGKEVKEVVAVGGLRMAVSGWERQWGNFQVTGDGHQGTT